MTDPVPPQEVAPNPLADLMASPMLMMASDVLDDQERLRIANENRLRQLVLPRPTGFGLLPSHIQLPADSADKDDVKVVDVVLENAQTLRDIQQAAHDERRARNADKGVTTPALKFKLPAGWDPFVWQMCQTVVAQRAQNVHATKSLEQTIQEHPLYPWIEAQKGLGAKQVGRLLAAIGDPYWNVKFGRPRTVSELWSYSGYAVVNGSAPARRKGVRITWSTVARMRCRMISESCMKSGGPYRAVYDQSKEFCADAVHQASCVRCGPAGSPAQPGSPLSKNHIHARALRRVSKEILKDLWRQAREIHTRHGFGPQGSETDAA